MIIETIFKGTLTGISGLVAAKTFEQHIVSKIPVLEKLIVNHKIPNDKLVELIKFTVNEAFEKFNTKHKVNTSTYLKIKIISILFYYRQS